MPLSILEQQLTEKLFAIGAIKFDLVNGFTMKFHEKHCDWPKSPIYLNLRTDRHPVPEKRGSLDEEALHLTGEVLRPHVEYIRDTIGVQLVADIPDAGTPFGDQVVRVLNMSDIVRLQLTKQNLPDGQRRIGPVAELLPPLGGFVILVDDLCSGADTKWEAYDQLVEAGYLVVLILVLVDREVGGVQQLRDAGLNIQAAMKLSDMLAHLVSKQLITPEAQQKALDYPEVIKKLQDAL